jgi:3-hydroxyisobutyrate dehydrogenase-like beta-hydroxyacid dehydrogenase
MAARLASRGFRVVAYDALATRGAALETRGVQRARTPRHVERFV